MGLGSRVRARVRVRVRVRIRARVMGEGEGGGHNVKLRGGARLMDRASSSLLNLKPSTLSLTSSSECEM